MKRYRLEAQLGEGTMGTVYRARDLDLDRPVAVKVLKPSAFADETIRKRFVREAQVTAALSHPNLVTVYDAGNEDNSLYLVMELVEGTSLDKMIEKKEKSVTYFLEILEKVARGVHQAHERGAVHRDLKPANILVSKAGVPKVTDFGLAHLMQADSLITRSGATVGTPVYMAPEQAQGLNQAISPRTDVYALGAILYEIATGRPPHDGKTIVEIYEKIIHRAVIAPRRLNAELHPDVERIILKAIEKKPAGRYRTALEFADDAKRHLEGEPVLASAARTAGKSKIGWVLAGVAILAIAVVAALLTKKGGEEPVAQPSPVAPTPATAAKTVTTAAWPELAKLSPAFQELEDSWYSGRPQAAAEAKLREIEPRFREVEVRHATSSLPKAWLALAHMYLNNKKWKDELAEACRDAGDDPGPWIIAAQCHLARYARTAQVPSVEFAGRAVGVAIFVEADDLKAIRTEALAALDHAGKSAAILKGLADGLELMIARKYPEALALFEKGSGDPLAQGTADEFSGLVLFLAGKFREAVTPHHRLAERGRYRACYVEGMCWLSLATEADGDPFAAYDSCLEAIARGIVLDPEPSSGYSHRGVALLRKGIAEQNAGRPFIPTLDGSLAACEEAIKRNPTLMDPYGTMTSCLLSRADIEETQSREPLPFFEKALAIYDGWVQRVPNHAQILYQRGNTFNRRGGWLSARNRECRADFQKALEDYDKAIRIQPFAECYCNRGNVFQSIAHLEDKLNHDSVPIIMKAIESYNEALKLNPKLPEGLNNRGNARILLADLETAAGRDPRAFREQAMEDYTRAVEAKVDYFNAWLNIGNVSMVMGDAKMLKHIDASKEYLRSLDAYDHGFKLRPDVWNFYTARAYLFVRLGRREDASACFDAGMKAFASNPSVLAQLKTEREKLLK